jgi:Cdc6-like AAA superfamily ATPase
MNEFNLANIGRPLARITGGKLDKRLISVAPSGEVNPQTDKTFNCLNLPDDAKFQVVPDTKKERDILYITGPSGSGKTTFTAGYLEQYKKKYPKNPIYIFSALKEDETLDKIKGVKRIKIGANLIADPLEIDDLKDSCCVFDDIDVISDKKHREAVYKILNSILETGRHTKTSCINTNHLPTNKGETRRILNESHIVVYFPHSGSVRGVNYLLQEYVGLSKNEIADIKRLPSRWCCIFKNFPQIVMTERNMWFVGGDCEEDD